ncbi:hypothetical protein [Methylobacterium sp. NEAU K]|uniref:hypothetical protein n=1 Tax=Methylobacterium sp. NEAU K TaxID=3064946 RepID=UPI00273697F2|nr:hypothetical protein [Methylobacterium sp. NEAU K]MDP4003021.1 hypothetical protein [Methylobacterium sp. NEAU K]
MKTIAANHADCLRRPASEDTPEALVVDTVSGELRVLYGETTDDLPAGMAVLLKQLDGIRADRMCRA